MKKFVKMLALILAMILVAIPLASCNEGRTEDKKAEKGDGYVSLDINPSVEITFEDGKVTGVYASNEDARVLLYNEETLVGMTLEEAIAKITDLAVENGYLTEDNSVINILSSGVSEEQIAEFQTKISEIATNCGFDISLDEGITFSLERQLAEFKAKYPTDKTIQALTPENFKLALSASETGDVDLEVAVKMDEETLVAYLNDTFAKVENFATEAYQKAKETANAVYEQAENYALSGVYTTLYTKYALKHANTLYYGAVYQIYQTLATALNAYASVLEKIEAYGITDYEIQEENLNAILTAFGVDPESEEATALKNAMKNEDGKITLASAEAYCDKYVKNATEEQKANLETVKTALTTALETTEEAWGKAFSIVAQVTYLQITTLLTTCETALGVVDASVSVASLLNTKLKDEFATYKNNITGLITTLKEMMAVNAETPLTSTSLSQFASTLKVKASEVKNLIDADLSDEEKAEIQTEVDNLKTTLDGYKATYDQALADAEEQAKLFLQQAKEGRKADK